MTDDRDLEGLDPYNIMATEVDRLDRHFSGLRDDEWNLATRCQGWSVRDVRAHMTSSEKYNRACLEGTVAALIADTMAKGASDLASANEIGIHEYDGRSPESVLEEWRASTRENLAGFRARDGGEIDSSVG